MEALAFIDLLGFSQMVSSNHTRAKSILNDFYNISYQFISEQNEIQGDLFSDSLLAHSSNPAILVNTISKIYRECLKENRNYDFPLDKYFLLPRGGVSFGHVEIQDRNESPNITKNFIVSPALVHSAKMESQIKGSRLLIADIEYSNEQVFNWNTDIKSLLYENSTFTFWSKFKYFDSLWFLDLSKTYEQQKNEVISLIEISETLVKANDKNIKVREQHLQTLRIGLLSFSKFLTPNNNPLLDRFLDEYRDDSYWLIWLTLIEMMMYSLDNWNFSMKAEVINFYKNVSLKRGWSNVINEINKPKNENLHTLFEQFISMLGNENYRQ